MLLIERAAPPSAGMWALPGGFLLEGESLDDAAKRKLDLEPTPGKEIQEVVDEIFKTPASVVERVKPFLSESGG